jgi:hypothetical protein
MKQMRWQDNKSITRMQLRSHIIYFDISHTTPAKA